MDDTALRMNRNESSSDDVPNIPGAFRVGGNGNDEDDLSTVIVDSGNNDHQIRSNMLKLDKHLQTSTFQGELVDTFSS